MNLEKTSNLSFYNEQGILTLNAKQFDTGRIFVFHIMHNDAPFDLSGCTAYLRIAKADGTQFQGHECCTIEGSKVIIKTNIGNGSQILTAAGTNVCELYLKDANDIGLTTWTFHIVVEPRVHDGSHMSSIDSYDVLDNMINMEKDRIASEEQRKENEKQRKENETNRNTVFEEKIEETNAVITDCRLVIDTANQKISSFDAEINEIVDGITDEAQSYADNAKASETNAANSASSAADSVAAASQKASDAAASTVLSQSYAVGGTGTREGEDSDNAKEYAKQAKASADELREKYILKTEKGASEGVATLDGNGKIPEGQLPDNIGSVTGVKGDKESYYRTGDVSITPENMGALSLKGGTVSGKVTVNNSFIVNKTSTSNPTGITELDIHNDGKVAINTIADGTKNDSLIHFDGGVGGTITNRATNIESYVKNIRQHNYDLRVSSNNTIFFDTRDFRVDDDWGFGIRVKGGDVYIGDTPNGPYESDDDSGLERLWIQAQSTSGTSQTRLFTDNFNIGRQGDYFLEYNRFANEQRFKIRWGNNGSNWTGDTFAANDGISITNYNSDVYAYLCRMDGTSLFDHKLIARGISGETFGIDLDIRAGHSLLLTAWRGESRVCLEDKAFSSVTCIDLGTPSRKWKNIYATNGTIQTSDRNEKNTIEELTADKAQQLIYGLKPSTYHMNAGTSGRTHWGMISQDIEELFDKIGMTSLDFAGFIKSPKMHIEEEECDEKGKITKERVEEVIEGEYDYSLRYDEFIAPIIKVIQTQHEKIETLTKRIDFLEQQINNC